MVNGQTKLWGAAEGLPEGLGKRVLRFQNTAQYEHCNRTIPVRGGQTYLYTAWVRNEDMDCGSNMTQHLADGKEVRLYDTQVMRCGKTNPFWQVFTCRKEMPAGTQTVAFTPVAIGAGWATYDNIRVTLFEGTDYAAEAHRAKSPPRIDGNLDDWVKRCSVPLIGRNQLRLTPRGAGFQPASTQTGPTSQTSQTRPTPATPDYTWTPANLSAIAYLMWDDANLYVAVYAQDDVHHAAGSGSSVGEAMVEGDSLILAFDPTKRGGGSESKSFAYYLSSAVPGGGSGKHTLFRPKEHSGGRPSGHLFRDSSIYDLAVVAGNGVCVYELRIPVAELGVPAALGTKLGLSLQLNDNDGAGRTAQMNWGGGLHPSWFPAEFGVVTLVESDP